MIQTMVQPKLYSYSTHIGIACKPEGPTFVDLATKLKMDLGDLMAQCSCSPGEAERSAGSSIAATVAVNQRMAAIYWRLNITEHKD
jgi:hypothetical protein